MYYQNSSENKNRIMESSESNSFNVLQIALMVLCFIFALIGVFSNIAMIHIFKQKDLKVRFNCLIIVRAVFDLITICCFLFTGLMYLIKVEMAPWMFLCACAFNCSAFTMTTIALERYLVLCKNK